MLSSKHPKSQPNTPKATAYPSHQPHSTTEDSHNQTIPFGPRHLLYTLPHQLARDAPQCVAEHIANPPFCSHQPLSSFDSLVAHHQCKGERNRKRSKLEVVFRLY